MKTWIVVALMGAVFAAFLHVYTGLDYGKWIHSHRPGVCRVVEGPRHGSEGLTVVEEEGIAFISSGVQFMGTMWVGDYGRIFLYNFSQPISDHSSPLRAIELPFVGKNFHRANFHPHGISHWVVNGVIRLFVINHDNAFKHSVEVFDYDKKAKALVHVKSVKGDALIRPNDITATGRNSFIWSNDGAAQTMAANFVEILLSRHVGSIGYYDGRETRVLLDGLPGPNGILYDDSRKVLYVSMTIAERIDVFRITEAELTLLSQTAVHTVPDNLLFGSDGAVYAGAHPIMHLAAAHMSDCSNMKMFAPSQVLRLKYEDPARRPVITEIYANDGSEVSASSVAALFQNQLLIGSVCRQLLHCEIVDETVL